MVMDKVWTLEVTALCDFGRVFVVCTLIWGLRIEGEGLLLRGADF